MVKVKANIRETLQKIEEGNYPTREYPEENKTRERETTFVCVKRLMEKAPRLTKRELLEMHYVPGKQCPSWAIDRVYQERGEKLSIVERTEVQKDAMIRNRVIELIAAKKRSEATELIVNKILEDNYIYTTRDDSQEEVWVYEQGVYVPNGKSRVKEIVREILGIVFTTQLYNEILAKIEADTYIDAKELFQIKHKEEIAVQNGILNVLTFELSDFTPHKIFFNKCPVYYDPNAQCEMVDSFLKDVLANEEDIAVFYELGGFALYKEYTFEKAFMFVGNGRNGKGKSLELLKRIIGPANCFSLSLSAISTDNADVSQLHNKMINLAGDIGNKDLKDTAMFKALTGRDFITARRKYLNAITFENYAKFVFACNELPMVYDLSKGFWDRWVLLQFPYYFADEREYNAADDKRKKTMKIRDENIISKISTANELSGLLNRFLIGLQRLLKNKGFSSTKGSEQIKDTWIRMSNSFIAFCMDSITQDYGSRISKKELRRRYTQYCQKHKVGGKSDFVIKRVLQEKFGASEERIFGNFSNNGEWYWEGIKWNR